MTNPEEPVTSNILLEAFRVVLRNPGMTLGAAIALLVLMGAESF